jgi:hypothetical protein
VNLGEHGFRSIYNNEICLFKLLSMTTISIDSLLNPRQLTKEEFRNQILDKGWRLSDVALRWRITKHYLSHIIANEERDSKWNDLVYALPKISRLQRKTITEVRRKLRSPTKVARNRKKNEVLCIDEQEPKYLIEDPRIKRINDDLGGTSERGLRYSGFLMPKDELILIIDLGSFGSEGDYVTVEHVKREQDQFGKDVELYFVVGASGDGMWATPDQIDLWATATGRSFA